MRSFKKPNVECNPCSSQNVSNITSFKYHDSQHQTYSPMVHRLPSIHPVYLKYLKPFTSLHYPAALPILSFSMFLRLGNICWHGNTSNTCRHPWRIQGLGQEAAGDSPSYSPSRDWTCCVSASKIIKIMVKERVCHHVTLCS